jgi:hypothetical protein
MQTIKLSQNVRVSDPCYDNDVNIVGMKITYLFEQED